MEAVDLAWNVHHAIPRPQSQSALQRTLQSHENALLKSANNSWDPNKIRSYVGNPSVSLSAWTVGKHSVLFYGQGEDHVQAKTIVEECGRLWDWLGVERPFTLIIWWRNDPRYLKAVEWPTRETINGGWTNQNSSVIHIYRSEEWDRVFIHEMIHALGWDWKMPEKPLACWGLPHNSNTVPALFEAWTELYAEWLWCIWHSMSWSKQREWQDYQAIQILSRYSLLGLQTWQENTSVFAYYILKAALAPHIAELLLFGNGTTAKEREQVLCHLASPGLRELVQKASHTSPVPMSLRMTMPRVHSALI